MSAERVANEPEWVPAKENDRDFVHLWGVLDPARFVHYFASRAPGRAAAR